MISQSDMAELTDKGRQTTLALGDRLRHLYVYQLGFLPEVINDRNTVFLRSSNLPRTLSSLQQTYTGLYPPQYRSSTLEKPTIVLRRLAEETLMPSEDFCPRFVDLIKAYSQRTAARCMLTTYHLNK